MLEIGKKTVPHTIAPPSRKRKRCFLGKTEMIGCIWLTKKLGGSGNKNHPGFLISCSFHHSYVFQWIKVNWLHSIHGIHYDQKHVAFCIRRLTNQRFFSFFTVFFLTFRDFFTILPYGMRPKLSCFLQDTFLRATPCWFLLGSSHPIHSSSLVRHLRGRCLTRQSREGHVTRWAIVTLPLQIYRYKRGPLNGYNWAN